MKSKCNENMLEQLYINKTIDSDEMKQYALKIGVSCQKLNNFILSEQYKNNIVMTNLFSKIIAYNLYSNFDVEHFYEVISSIDEIEYFCSSLDYEHPNLKQEPMDFIWGLEKFKNAPLDVFELYNDNVTTIINIYDENTINSIVELAHKSGISTKKLVAMINDNFKTVCGKIDKLIKPQMNDKKHLQERLFLLKNTNYLPYKVSALEYNYPTYCQNNFQLLNAILNCDINDLLKYDSIKSEDETLKNFVLKKRKNQK